jgi:formate hydrogenlyase transcriptional activator
MVEEGEFRADLFYRLSLFPITLPPLRERREDIPSLVEHFTTTYARLLNRPIESISSETMQTLVQYSWPGNIRELQNFIERSVILSTGPALESPLEELVRSKVEELPEPVTLKDAQRAQIVRALEKTNGQLAGAAALLGVPRSTLFYAMRRLGISSPRPAKKAAAC